MRPKDGGSWNSFFNRGNSIMLWKNSTVYHESDSPRVKRDLNSCIINFAYKMFCEYSNDLTLSSLGN